MKKAESEMALLLHLSVNADLPLIAMSRICRYHHRYLQKNCHRKSTDTVDVFKISHPSIDR